MGRTKDQLEVKEADKAQWESQVNKDSYVPDNLKIGQDVGMFLYNGILKEFIEDVAKECSKTELFDESLAGKIYNYTPSLGRRTEEPQYKLRMRYVDRGRKNEEEKTTMLLVTRGD